MTLDPAAIERLRKLGGAKFAADMIDLFLSYGAKKVAETQAARQAGNLAGVAAAAHALKSSAGNVGAVRIQQLAEQIEQLAKRASGDAVAAEVAALERAFAEIRPRLEAEQAKLKPLQDSSRDVG
jgi:HPt (histidine-containing phosphotransfer) domain-containing protein